MFVTGPNSAMMTADEMARIKSRIDPTINALAETTQGIDRALSLGTAAPTAARGSSKRLSPHAAFAMYNTLMQRLNALKSTMDTSGDPLMKMLALLKATAGDGGSSPSRAEETRRDAVAVTVPAVALPPPTPPTLVAPSRDGAKRSETPVAVRAPEPERTAVAAEQAKVAEPTRTDDDDMDIDEGDAARPPKKDDVKPPAATSTPTSTKRTLLLDEDKNLSVPLANQYHKKLRMLYKYVQDNPKVIRAGAHGSVVVNGKEISGSNFSNILTALYMARGTSKKQLPHGTEEVLSALAKLDVPSNLMSSSAVTRMYDAMRYKPPAAVAGKSTNVSAKWLESPGQGGKGVPLPPPTMPGKPLKLFNVY